MDVLLSIKPKYVKAILEGEKRFEFRREIFKHREINRAYIYASSPVKKIVAMFDIGDILEDDPVNLWDNVKNSAGINDLDFFHYFKGKSKAYAIEIQHLQKLDHPIDPKKAMPGFVPPHSFCYLDGIPKAK